MKNQKVLIIVAILLLLLGGGYMLMKPKTTGTNNLGSTTSNSKGGSIFTSVKDALSKKMTLVCEFNDQTGVSTKSYIKNGAVRVSSAGSTGTSQSSDIIIKDKKMYMWDSKTKQGFVYDIPDAESNNVGVTTSEANQSESYLNMIDQYKDSCKVATVEDSYFVPPTDVKFQDMSKLLEDLKKQNPQMPQGY